jgi:CDP-4-dehydro-6-deoxyglucose reductase, E3
MQARLIHYRQIAPEVRHFEFEAVGLDRLDFVPGQFVSLTADVEGKPITRAYSLASAPNGTNRFELCLNCVEGGRLSPRIFAMQPGDRMAMSAPLGTFTLREPARDSILIATGTGITPFRSYLRAFLAKGAPQFTLLLGARYEAHLLYRQEFEAMAQQHPQFRFWPTLSRPEPSWYGRSGHVQAHLAEAIGGRTDVDFYLCGLAQMVDDVRAMLKEMGFDRKQIRSEKYD